MYIIHQNTVFVNIQKGAATDGDDKLAEKFAKNKDCTVQMQSLIAIYGQLSQVPVTTGRPYKCLCCDFNT